MTFKDVEMILLDFFDICDSLRNPKFPFESWVHLALVVFVQSYLNSLIFLVPKISIVIDPTALSLF